MSDSSTWRLNIGRWFRVPFRVHALFVAVAVFAVYLSTSDPTQNAVGYGLLGVGILFLSVLAHELGHCVAAVRLGGTPEVIVIGPLGGLGTDEPPRQFHGELITAAAGPVVNLLLLVAALPVLIGTGENIAGLLSPIEPIDLVTGAWWMVTAKLVFWINWLLLCVNLLPAFPFDGARVLRSLLCPALDYRSATHVAVRTSRLTALGVCLLAWWLADVQSAAHLAAWVPLTLLAVFIYFSAQHETRGSRKASGTRNCSTTISRKATRASSARRGRSGGRAVRSAAGWKAAANCGAAVANRRNRTKSGRLTRSWRVCISAAWTRLSSKEARCSIG